MLPQLLENPEALSRQGVLLPLGGERGEEAAGEFPLLVAERHRRPGSQVRLGRVPQPNAMGESGFVLPPGR